MDPATICEEDHKLATVCLIKYSGLRDSDSVQDKIVQFKSVFSIVFFFVVFFLSKLYILSYILFHFIN